MKAYDHRGIGRRSRSWRAALFVAVLVASLLQTPVASGSNGIVYDGDSAYELVTDTDLATRNFWVATFRAFFRPADGCDWSHLATITSEDEQDIVSGLMADSDRNAWLGGFQRRNALIADEGWRWITRAPWDFTAWAGGEPNDLNFDDETEPGFEQYLEALLGDGSWNDVPNPDPVGEPKYFIVESEGCD